MLDLKPIDYYMPASMPAARQPAADLVYCGTYVKSDFGTVECSDCGVDILYIYACLIGGCEEYTCYHCYLARIGVNNDASK
jgi:hypothetical protein